MNNQPFQPPSRLWLFFIIPLAVAAIVWTAYSASELLSMEQPTIVAKYKVILGIIAMFTSFSFSVGYLYMKWAVPRKNLLFQLLKQNKNVVTFKFGRYFVNEQAIHDIYNKPLSIRWLQQRDLREVYEILESGGTK